MPGEVTGDDLFEERELHAAQIVTEGIEGHKRVLFRALFDGQPVAALGLLKVTDDGNDLRPLAIVVSDEMFKRLGIPPEDEALFIDWED